MLGRTRARIAARGSVSIALAAVGRGARLSPAGEPSIGARADRVTYRYPGVRAWYAAGPLGIEQGFAVARRPSGIAGAPLTVALDLSGSLSARGSRSAVRFLTSAGAVGLRYGGLAALDASGRALAATLELAHGRLLIRVRDQGARYPVRIDPLFQLCSKLTGAGESGGGTFGTAVSLSGDGSTALIGGPSDSGGVGAAWIFVRSGSGWAEQAKLTAGGETGAGMFGFSTALSSDGSTALIGAEGDASSAGAAWVFTRSGSAWTQQAKLTGNGEAGASGFGFAVALSGDGSTALVGGPFDSGNAGAAWAFARSGSTWSPGTKFTPGDETGAAVFGLTVSLSGAGNTALIGGSEDNSGVGAAWVFSGSGMAWTEQSKLTASGEVGAANFGDWVSLSADGSTALIGGFRDNGDAGAAWAFTSSGSLWLQLGSKLVPGDEVGPGRFGVRLALSADGNTAVIGGYEDNNGVGAAWVFTRSGSTWAQEGAKLTANDEAGNGDFGFSASLSGDGGTALIGAPYDAGYAGAAWTFGNAPPTCASTSAITAVGGGTVTLALQCSGPVGLPLTYGIVGGPAHGVLGPVNQTTGTVSYTPFPGYAGTDQFTYHATGADGASNTATATITIPRATARLNTTIGFTFRALRRYTLVLALYLDGVPRGARVRISCHGRHCPFSSRVTRLAGRKVCTGKGKHRHCRRRPPPRVGRVILTRFFRHPRLAVGTRVTITVTEPGTIGRVYIIKVRRSRAPAIHVTCLAPGSSTPGRGC